MYEGTLQTISVLVHAVRPHMLLVNKQSNQKFTEYFDEYPQYIYIYELVIETCLW